MPSSNCAACGEADLTLCLIKTGRRDSPGAIESSVLAQL
jgi:hypothetical protein